MLYSELLAKFYSVICMHALNLKTVNALYSDRSMEEIIDLKATEDLNTTFNDAYDEDALDDIFACIVTLHTEDSEDEDDNVESDPEDNSNTDEDGHNKNVSRNYFTNISKQGKHTLILSSFRVCIVDLNLQIAKFDLAKIKFNKKRSNKQCTIDPPVLSAYSAY